MERGKTNGAGQDQPRLKKGDRVCVKLVKEHRLDDRQYHYGAYVKKNVFELDDLGLVTLEPDAVASVTRVYSKSEIASALGLDPADPLLIDAKGTMETANYLNVERPRIGKWKDRFMPEVAIETRTGPIWWVDDIDALRPSIEARRRS